MSSDYKSEILRFLESCCDYLEAGGRLKKGDIPAFDKSALSRVSREGSVIILKLRDLTNALNKSSGYIPPKSQWTKSGDDFVFSKEVQDRSKIKVKPPKQPKPAPAKPTKAPKSPVGPQQGTGLTAGDIETIKATAAKLKSWDANKNNEEIAKYINQNKKKETGSQKFLKELFGQLLPFYLKKQMMTESMVF